MDERAEGPSVLDWIGNWVQIMTNPIHSQRTRRNGLPQIAWATRYLRPNKIYTGWLSYAGN